jgi:hypothetical protein
MRSTSKEKLRGRGSTSISNFQHHNINEGTVYCTWEHRKKPCRGILPYEISMLFTDSTYHKHPGNAKILIIYPHFLKRQKLARFWSALHTFVASFHILISIYFLKNYFIPIFSQLQKSISVQYNGFTKHSLYSIDVCKKRK